MALKFDGQTSRVIQSIAAAISGADNTPVAASGIATPVAEPPQSHP